MVSILWATIAALLGFLGYLLIPFLAGAGTVRMRHKVAQYYWGLATRSLGKIALIRRTVGGYTLKKLKYDDEKGAGKVVLDDSLLGDSKDLHFDDPDNRMGRINRKPVAIVHEEVPGVVDPQLADLGKHWRDHYSDGKHRAGENEELVNPHFEVDTGTRMINVDDVLPIIMNGSEPTDVGTVEAYTRKRFEKYGDGVGATEMLSALMGFATALLGMAGIAYVRDNLLDGGAGGAPENPVPVMIDVMDLTAVADLAVILL